MAYVRDTITWASDETDLKTYIGVTGTAEDFQLKLWLDAGAYAADDYIESDWIDEDTGLDITQPPGVKLGVYEYVRAARSQYLSGAGGGLTSVKTGQLQEWYRTGSGSVGDYVLGSAAFDAAAVHWRRYKVDLLIAGVK